jgi:hypothetical protein
MTALSAFNLLGNIRLAHVETDYFYAGSCLAQQLAGRFECALDDVDFDEREDGVSYVTVRRQIVGYTTDGMAPWEADPADRPTLSLVVSNDRRCINVAAEFQRWDRLLDEMRDVLAEG